MTHGRFERMKPLCLAGLALAAIWCAPPARGEALDRVLSEQAAANKAAAESQARIDGLADDTHAMLAKYRQALADTESLTKYNDQLGAQVKSQEEKLDNVKRQLAEIEATHREVLPLMQRMIDTLEQFVRLDVPFLLAERNKRVATLEQLLTRADVSISEKYRRILEAYQIEMEYGQTLEAYEDKLGEGDEARTVELVRVGRVALMYQTPDGKTTGYWDREKRMWVEDPSSAPDVKEALRIAKKRGAPDLLWVPVQAPTTVQSPKEGLK
jgi:hypothetical protein